MAVPRVIQRSEEHSIWKQYAYSPFTGVAAIVFFTLVALACVPADHAPRGALFWPALWMTLGILYVPAITVYRDQKSIIRAENLLALIPIFWLLLDLFQGSYSLEEAKHEAIVSSFVAIALFSSQLPWPNSSPTGRASRSPNRR